MLAPTLRPRSVLPFLLAVPLLLAGCSGSGTTSAGSASTSAVSSPVATTASASDAGGDAGAFCGLVKKQVTLLEGTELTNLIAAGTPAAWKAYFEKAAAANQELVDAAPAGVRDATIQVQKTTEALRTVLAKGDYDASAIDVGTLLTALQGADPAVATAFTGYVKTTCGVDLTIPQG